MENSPQQPDQPYHPKHHLKVYVWVALVVAALLVAINGYMYFLRLAAREQGAETSRQNEQATMITVRGTVVSNYQGCSFDDACVLTIQTDMGREIGVVYGGGLTPEGSCYISGGSELISGDQIEASGRFTDQSKNTISLCGPGAYLQKVNKEDSDWKIYTNTEYGFEFKYPNAWPDLKMAPDPKFYNGYTNLLNFCLPIIQGQENDSVSNCSEVYPGLAKVFYIAVFTPQQWIEDQNQPTNRSGFVERNDKYVFGIGVGHETLSAITVNGSELDQILSTFRFIDKTDTSPSVGGWRTYTNTEYGFELQYPEDWPIQWSDRVLTVGNPVTYQDLLCYLTITIVEDKNQGSIIRRPDKYNHYSISDIEVGRKCEETQRQILSTFKLTK